MYIEKIINQLQQSETEKYAISMVFYGHGRTWDFPYFRGVGSGETYVDRKPECEKQVAEIMKDRPYLRLYTYCDKLVITNID